MLAKILFAAMVAVALLGFALTVFGFFATGRKKPDDGRRDET